MTGISSHGIPHQDAGNTIHKFLMLKNADSSNVFSEKTECFICPQIQLFIKILLQPKKI